MNPRGYIILALVILLAIWALIALYRSPPASDPMRTADQRKIERETAAIRRNSRSLAAQERTEGGIYGARITSLCKERARRDARHQARMQDLDGTEPVNRYPEGDPCRVWWQIELAEAHTEIAHAKSPAHQFNH